MSDRARKRAASRLLQTGLVVCAALAAITCRDGTPPDLSAPGGSLTPGQAALAIAPRFASLPAGAPSITLATVKGLLISNRNDTIVVTAHFIGDVATLDFNVQFLGSSATYRLDLTAFDADGVIAYHAAQDVVLKPGANTSVTPVLVYAAPDAAVTALHVAPSVVTLNAGQAGSVSVTGTNATGQAVAPLRVGWTARSAAVTIDDNGNITAGSFQGTTYVVARTANNVADSAQVKVHAPVAKITAAPPTVQVVRGGTAAAAAELRDAGNNLIDDRTPTWTTADASIATVSAAGVITGVKIGTTTITATAEGKTAAVAVTVTTPLDHVELTPSTLTFASLHETKALTLKLVPKTPNGSTAGVVPVYTVDDPTIASVDQTGVVTALKNGTMTVTVTVDGLTATTTGTVKQVAATVTVTPKSVSVSSVGDVVRFTATALDALGSVIDGAVFTWTTSDPAVGTISSTGVLTAKRAGSVSVTAALDGKTDTGNLNVAPTTKGLALYATKNPIAVGGAATVTGRFVDGNGNPLSDAPTTFSTTTPGIVSVSPSGVVSGIAAGVGHITGVAGSFTAAIDITVTGTGGGGGGGGGGLVLNLTTAEKLPGSNENIFVVSGGTGPYSWTVNGIPDGNSTFGTISYGETSPAGVSITYYAPTSVPTPSVFDVCAYQISSGPSSGGERISRPRKSSEPPSSISGCVHVTISAIPSGGADVIVINDMNLWDNPNGASVGGANQSLFYLNLIGFSGSGSRASQKGFMFYRGHGSICASFECSPGNESSMYATLTGGGYTPIDFTADLTSSIDPTVKVILILTPSSPFSDAEANTLKVFASQGGRIIFSGEHGGYYGSYIGPVEDALLAKLGGHLTNTAAVVSCSGSYLVGGSNIRPHQSTAGLTNLSIPCASGINLGPDDYALIYDNLGTTIVGAVAKIDVTLIPSSSARPPVKAPAAKATKATIMAPSTRVDGLNKPKAATP